MVVINADGEVGQAGRTWEYITTLAAIVFGTADLPVVVTNNRVIQEKKSGASVSDSINAGLLEGFIPNSIAGASELPETVGRVNRCIGNVTRMFAIVNEAKVVRSRRALLQVDSENILFKNPLLDCSIEEGRVLSWFDCLLVSEELVPKTCDKTDLY